MDKELIPFIIEGMKNYKRASFVMQRFFTGTQSLLQNILRKRRDWGPFQPEEVKNVRSTKYWDNYPLINAQIQGKINKERTAIQIAINWWQSESDYPFFSIQYYEPASYNAKLSYFKKTGEIEFDESEPRLKLVPNSDDLNLDRDFNLLIDAFLKTIA